MKKETIAIVVTIMSFFSYAQEEADIILPKESPFQLGANVEGTIQNSVNETTGKVMFSVPITQMNANELTYPVSFSYNGTAALLQAKNTNEYNPTSTIGLGFDMAIPKIVADYKGTTARDDDTYYLIYGNNTKLLCTKKTSTYLEFATETYTQWKITLHLGKNATTYNELTNEIETSFVYGDEFWELVKENGEMYQFGSSYQPVFSYSVEKKPNRKAKSWISTWGNWIGNSIETPTGSMPVEWYLYSISDQWNNKLRFEYEVVEGRQNTNQVADKHTEAIYLKEIHSSDGSKITFTYGNKGMDEYFEPHTEKETEPDAYQEKYEKKYLEKIQTFNSNDDLVYTHELIHEVMHYTYPLDGKQYRAKRYLKEITQKNSLEEALPSQKMAYHTSGNFNGCIEKITYPTGGSVRYKYLEKNLFYNGVNNFSGTQPNTTGYHYAASYVGDNYTLKLYKSQNEVASGKHRYKIIRYTWNGSGWITSEFVLPNLIKPYHEYAYLDQFKAVFSEEYYGFLCYDRATDTADLYLFHLEKDGKTWKRTDYTNISVIAESGQDPVFIKGANFVAIGPRKKGDLKTYTLKNNGWSYKAISQPNREYFYGAGNNFILVLDENGGADMVTGISYADNYYIHYLDAEKNWQTKSWTSSLRSQINSIEKASYFYPNNTMAGFVAHDNPEYFLRWDAQYNLIEIDNVLGSAHSSSIEIGYILESASSNLYPLYPSSNGMFTLQSHFYKNPIKSARFNGVDWNVQPLNSDNSWTHPSYGEDFLLWKDDDKIAYGRFDPNTNTWNKGDFQTTYDDLFDSRTTALTPTFFIAGNTLFSKRHNLVYTHHFEWLEDLEFDNLFSYSDGRDYVFVKQGTKTSDNSIVNETFEKSNLYFKDKSTGSLTSIDLGRKYHMDWKDSGPTGGKFGGYTPFLSSNTMYLKSENQSGSFYTYLYRMIQGGFNKNVTDVVVEQIEIDNAKNSVRKIDYLFEDFHFLPNEITHYGKTTIAHKGFGTANNGKIVKYFNNGKMDIRLLGIPEKVEVRDANNTLKKETIIASEVYSKNYFNSQWKNIGVAFYVRTTNKLEKQYLEEGLLETEEDYTYDTSGRQIKIEKKNSKGAIEKRTTTYAEDFFLREKNMVNQPLKTTLTIDNRVSATTEIKWKNENGKAYPYQNWAGVTHTKLQKEVTKVDDWGRVLEEHNGKGIYSVYLMGYANKYPVATIKNATYLDVIRNLRVNYAVLQTLETDALKTELLQLYDSLPKATFSLTFYNANGNIINEVDSRKEELYYHYDAFNRLKYITDGEGNKLQETEYHYQR